METQTDSGLAQWSVPECPFIIDYSPRVLDDLRLAVTDAFFSLPRGGAEIGGVLLGHQEKSRITIVDSIPMECEHAFGPSFVMSPRDLAKLGELIAAAGRDPQHKIVGWYHSHTRSEIFLSEADLDIHNHFFPQAWQVALVLKPHTFQPMRAGFFFRGADNSVHAAVSYQEITIEAMPMRPMPVSSGGAAAAPALAPIPERPAARPVVDVAAVVEPEATVVAEVPPPSFLATPAPASRSWIAWVAVALGAALGGSAYQTRDRWLPNVHAMIAPAPAKLALSTSDREGQLQIHWNGAAGAAMASTGGSLIIIDGDQPQTVDLRHPHVLTGLFTYARKTARVDVTLVLAQPDGKEVREATLFAGAAPPAHPSAAIPVKAEPAPPAVAAASIVPADSAALIAENRRLREDFVRATERNKLLEKALEEMRKVIAHEEQRKRLELQSPETDK